MSLMPKVGQVFETTLDAGDIILCCVDVHTTMYGTYYRFFVLDGDCSDCPFRVWVEDTCGVSFGFGMKKAFASFNFRLIG